MSEDATRVKARERLPEWQQLLNAPPDQAAPVYKASECASADEAAEESPSGGVPVPRVDHGEVIQWIVCDECGLRQPNSFDADAGVSVCRRCGCLYGTYASR